MRKQLFKLRFQDKEGDIIYSSNVKDSFVPVKEDVIFLECQFYKVTGRFIDYHERRIIIMVQES